MKKITSILLIVLILLSGCVKNVEKKPIIENNGPQEINRSGGTEILEINDNYNNEGLIEVVFSMTLSYVAEVERLFVLVDGILSELSVNGSEMALYQDINEDTDFSRIQLVVKPSQIDNIVGENATLKFFRVGIEDSIVFGDDLNYLYSGENLLGDVNVKITKAEFSPLKPILPETSKEFVENEEFEDRGTFLFKEMQDEASEYSMITILSEDQSFLYDEQGFDGLFYQKGKKHVLGKMGAGSYYVYPLLNGNFMLDSDGNPLLYYYPDSPELMLYSPFDLEAYNVDYGDIISFLGYSPENEYSNFSTQSRILLEK